jgi:hypothetical protein
MTELAECCYRRYQQHVALADWLEANSPASEGWIVVVRFYATLQLMNAYLVDKGNVRLRLDATAHEDRKRAMERCPELRDAPKKYRALKDLSERIRYDPQFQLTEQHRESSKAFLAKIIAIVEPKVKKG